MGAFLEKPKTEKHNETGEGNGLRFGVSSMQGNFHCFYYSQLVYF
jgi:protein phosphatase 1B